MNQSNQTKWAVITPDFVLLCDDIDLENTLSLIIINVDNEQQYYGNKLLLTITSVYIWILWMKRKFIIWLVIILTDNNNNQTFCRRLLLKYIDFIVNVRLVN